MPVPQQNDDCPICLGAVEARKGPAILTCGNCGYAFHLSCLTLWAKSTCAHCTEPMNGGERWPLGASNLSAAEIQNNIAALRIGLTWQRLLAFWGFLGSGRQNLFGWFNDVVLAGIHRRVVRVVTTRFREHPFLDAMLFPWVYNLMQCLRLYGFAACWHGTAGIRALGSAVGLGLFFKWLGGLCGLSVTVFGFMWMYAMCLSAHGLHDLIFVAQMPEGHPIVSVDIASSQLTLLLVSIFKIAQF